MALTNRTKCICIEQTYLCSSRQLPPSLTCGELVLGSSIYTLSLVHDNMREILYFQAGTFANFVGTHFWNAQESYFTYGEDAEEPFVDHDVSFREGLNERVSSAYALHAQIPEGS